MRKWPLVAALLAAALASGCAEKKKKPDAPPPSLETYGLSVVKMNHWNEDLWIDFKKMKIIHTATIYEYDNPVSGTPSGSSGNASAGRSGEKFRPARSLIP